MFNRLCLFSFPETPDIGIHVAFLLPRYWPRGCNEGSGVPVLKSSWCWLEMGESISTMGAEGGVGTRATQSAAGRGSGAHRAVCFRQSHLLRPLEVVNFPLTWRRG